MKRAVRAHASQSTAKLFSAPCLVCGTPRQPFSCCTAPPLSSLTCPSLFQYLYPFPHPCPLPQAQVAPLPLRTVTENWLILCPGEADFSTSAHNQTSNSLETGFETQLDVCLLVTAQTRGSRSWIKIRFGPQQYLWDIFISALVPSGNRDRHKKPHSGSGRVPKRKECDRERFGDIGEVASGNIFEGIVYSLRSNVGTEFCGEKPKAFTEIRGAV